ncbi:MAG: hypothetical protein ACE5GE_04860 [Phycisphaerae bacterium]
MIWVTAITPAVIVMASLGCQSSGGGGGGGGPSGGGGTCAQLALRAAELSEDVSNAPNAFSADVQCPVLANNLAMIDAGCFRSSNFTDEFTLDDFKQGVIDQQSDLECE